MRRDRIAVAVFVAAALLVGAALAVPTGAVPTGAIDVSGTEDRTENLELAPSKGPNGKYATITDDDEIALAFDVFEARSVSSADDVFEITVMDDDVEALWIGHETDGVTFYRGTDRDAAFDESNRLAVDAGSTVSVGVSIDTEHAIEPSSTFEVYVEMADDEDEEEDEDDEEEDDRDENETDGPGADVELTDVVVSPSSPTVGDAVTVTATYANRGNGDGAVTAELTVDGEVVDRRTIDVPAGETRSVTFERVIDRSGTVEIGIGDQKRSVTVVEPGEPAPNLSVTDVDLRSDRIRPGETVVATAAVENSGDATGERTIRFAIGGVVLDTRTVELRPGERRTVTFEWRLDEPGTYAVAIDGIDAGAVTVSEGATITVANREIDGSTTAATAPPLALGALFAIGAVRRRRDLWARWE